MKLSDQNEVIAVDIHVLHHGVKDLSFAWSRMSVKGTFWRLGSCFARQFYWIEFIYGIWISLKRQKGLKVRKEIPFESDSCIISKRVSQLLNLWLFVYTLYLQTPRNISVENSIHTLVLSSIFICHIVV